VRHGQPIVDREALPRLTWQEYVGWWQRYEASSLKPGQVPPKALLAATARAPFLFASIRPRAIETAQAIAGARHVRSDPMFVEAALPPPRWGKRQLLPKTWNKWARLWWMFGHSLEDEPKSAAKARARQAAARLVETAEAGGHDVVLCAHGWFNRMLRPEFARLGWRCVRDGGDSYWSFRVYERR
jgi:broad specificity phosphatase PhoE